MKAYFGSRISDNMTVTPERYLICHNVPIARSGRQEYLAEELGFYGRHGEKMTVVREEGEVFSPATLASFEGKPLTDNHPAEDVEPSNYSAYIRGVVQNVRRGAGDDADKILADLVVYDPKLIEDIRAGKREISCGYDSRWEETPGGEFRQADIRGNHVAVVRRGRAGKEVSIRDSEPKKGDKPMSENSKKGILARMFKAFAKDAEPEEVEKALDAIAPEEAPPAPGKEGGGLAALEGRVAELEKKLAEIAAAPPAGETGEIVIPEKDALPEEESVTIDPQKIEDGEEKELPKQVLDSAVRAALKVFNPVLASVRDEKERKSIKDSVSAAIAESLTQMPKEDKETYGKLLKRTRDAALDAGDEYKAACDQRNPHKQKQ
jgi:hypothetical protein